MGNNRRLAIVRHAKSDWSHDVADRRRPLAPRGERDAPLMGRWIGRVLAPLGAVVVSPAQRTQQTWALMAPHVGTVRSASTDPRVYEAWGEDLVSVINELPESAMTAVLVGHEPGVSELALTLSNHHNQKLRRRIVEKFPTCSLALLESAVPWADFHPGCADLVEFVTPKDFL